MLAVGEEIQPGYDELVETEFDYPMRNVYQISKSRGVIVVTGGDGTLEEILPALIDYDLPVSVLRGSGTAALALEALLEFFPAWKQNVLLSDDAAELVSFILEQQA